MSVRRETRMSLAIIAVCLALVLGGQAVGDRVLSAPSDATGAAVGRAGLSYLTGIRRYAGAILWNRIDPLLHTYYEGVPLDQQRYMLSTIAAVEWLDPTFDQPYYVGAWILARNDRLDDGLAMAREGIARIPDSGTLHLSYAQMLYTMADDTPGAVAQALLAIGPDMRWTDDVEKLNGYAALAKILEAGGATDVLPKVQAEIDRLDALVGDQPLEDEH